MKYMRLTAVPDPAVAPTAFRAIADSPHATESRLLEWNHANDRTVLALLAVEGDLDRMGEELSAAPAVADVDCTPGTDGRFHVLLRLDAARGELLQTVFDAIVRQGLLVRKPVVYRDGGVHATFIGESEILQAALEGLPAAVEVTVHEIGDYGGVGDGLTDRQRAALRAGLDLGYYEVPRRATHADVADRLGCSPSTATEHLQKAEARLVRGVVGTTARHVRIPEQ